MSGDPETNAAERQRWNDEYWTSVWPKREQMTGAVTSILLGHLALTTGERVLDVGSGGGVTSLPAAGLVGETGSVVGADISAPLIDLARRRAADQGVSNLSFVLADVQLDDIPGAPFDVAMSQFGVMFFDQPETAFANIHRQVTPGGRLGFACWQPIENNPWFFGPALADYVPPPPPPAPGKSASGPFSLGDPARAREILTAGGWTAIERAPYELVITIDAEAIVDDAQLTFQGVSEEHLAAAREVVDRHLEPLRRPGGRLEVPLAVQIFTARA